MTAADFVSMREFLGLPLGWVARRAGVTVSAVQNWESGRYCVPPEVAAMLSELERSVESIIGPIASSISSLDPSDRPSQIILVRYINDSDLWRFRPDMSGLPATFHGAMLNRLQRLLWAAGVQPGIKYLEPKAYLAWLGSRQDSESMRSEWALLPSS